MDPGMSESNVGRAGQDVIGTVTDDTQCPVWHKLAICRKGTGSDHSSWPVCRTGTGFMQHNTDSSCIATFCVLARCYPCKLLLSFGGIFFNVRGTVLR